MRLPTLSHVLVVFLIVYQTFSCQNQAFYIVHVIPIEFWVQDVLNSITSYLLTLVPHFYYFVLCFSNTRAMLVPTLQLFLLIVKWATDVMRIKSTHPMSIVNLSIFSQKILWGPVIITDGLFNAQCLLDFIFWLVGKLSTLVTRKKLGHRVTLVTYQKI